MTANASEPKWQTIAILTGRLIFAGVFLMAVFKYAGMKATGTYIEAAGFPYPYLLAWVAAIFECCWCFAFSPARFFQKLHLSPGFMSSFLRMLSMAPPTRQEIKQSLDSS